MNTIEKTVCNLTTRVYYNVEVYMPDNWNNYRWYAIKCDCDTLDEAVSIKNTHIQNAKSKNCNIESKDVRIVKVVITHDIVVAENEDNNN